MSEVKKPSETIIAEAYDKIASELHHKGGVNPYAYRLGFVDGWVAAASPVSDAVDMEIVKWCVRRLTDLMKYHINPYNLGEHGEVGSLITSLAQLFKLPPTSSPTPTNVQEQGQDEPPCNICGGKTVLIRGKYPGTDKRNVCPQCTTERLEQIQDIASPDYGRTSKA